MEKLLAMHIAAQLTQAACGGIPTNLNVSADLSDPAVRAKNLQVWETFRVFYRGILGALADTQSWPSPKFDFASILPSLLQSFAPFLSSGPLADIIKKFISTPTPTPAPSGPLPDPGQN